MENNKTSIDNKSQEITLWAWYLKTKRTVHRKIKIEKLLIFYEEEKNKDIIS